MPLCRQHDVLWPQHIVPTRRRVLLSSKHGLRVGQNMPLVCPGYFISRLQREECFNLIVLKCRDVVRYILIEIESVVLFDHLVTNFSRS